MGFLDRFRRKVEKAKEQVEEMSDLEKICMDEREVYEALRGTMFLDPRRVGVSTKEAADKAKGFRKQKDDLRARIWFQIAGGLAIYEGDAKMVKEYFSKSAELLPDSDYAILKIPDRAVSKAQEYYQKRAQIQFSW